MRMEDVQLHQEAARVKKNKTKENTVTFMHTLTSESREAVCADKRGESQNHDIYSDQRVTEPSTRTLNGRDRPNDFWGCRRRLQQVFVPVPKKQLS